MKNENIKHSGELEKFLALVLPAEDKSRTLKFIKNDDYESAAWIVKNLRNSIDTRTKKSSESPRFLEVPRASEMLPSSLPKSKSKSKDIPRKAYSRSITPTRTTSIAQKQIISSEISPIPDMIIYLQCQASVIEGFLE